MVWVLIVLSLLVIGIYYLNLEKRENLETIRTEVNPTPTLRETMEPVKVIETGKIEGKICYPSSFIPKGSILAKEVMTGEVKRQVFEMNEGSQNFAMELDKGSYVVAYQPDEMETMGFYTKCAIDLENCISNESHQLIEVEVGAGETVEGIDICDYYYQPENRPKW